MAVVSLIPTSMNVELYAGDGATIKVTASNLDLTGEIKAQIKQARSDPAPKVMWAIDDTQAATGVLTLRLTGIETAGLLNGTGNFAGVWDLQWTAPGAQPRTLVQGNVTCVLDVSR